MIKLIIFDWDKTLYDSKELPKEIFARLFGKKGKKVAEIKEFIGKTYGLPIYYGVREVYKRFLGQNPSRRKIIRGVRAFYKLYLKYKKRLFPNCKKILKKLHKNHKIAVISGHSTKPLRELVYYFLDKSLVDYVIGSPAYKSSNIKFLMKKFKAKANEIVLVGDSLKDLDEASKVGINFIGITNKIRKKEIMLKNGAFSVIKSLNELPQKIKLLEGL